MRRRFSDGTEPQLLSGRHPARRARHHGADGQARHLQPLDLEQGYGRLCLDASPRHPRAVDRQQRLGHLRIPGGQQHDSERTADAGGGQGRQLRMVVRRPRFAGRQERRGAGHRLRSRPVRTERPALFLALADARRDELRLGRGELPPHRLLRRGDGQGLRQAVFHDGDAHAAGRHGAFGGREGYHRARADVQHAGDALGAGRRHECHAGRRRFGDVPHPLGGRLSGDGSGVRRRSRRHVQRAQDLDRPFGLDGPHRLHLHARSAVAENL